MTVECPVPAGTLGVTPLIAVKLNAPPARTGFVPRPELLARLDDWGEAVVTVLSAPAGFGKTSLLAAWLASEQRPAAAAWLSLEPDDSEPPRFWAYLLAAMRRAAPELPTDLDAPLRAPQPQIDAFVAALANAMAALPVVVTLVLDDYHVIGNPEIHRSLATLIERRPPGLRLVLAGRADPPLPLAYLRARNLLQTLRTDDLRFSRDEICRFLSATIDLKLNAHTCEALEDYTEGWPAGIQLAALWLRDHPDGAESAVSALADEDRYLIEFLADEIFMRQSPEVQSFLLITAILERMCPALCEHLIAQARQADDEAPALINRPAAVLIEELEQRNLFVEALDPAHEWHRYHCLFSETLRRQLSRRRDPDRIAQLHCYAADWFASAAATTPALLGEALNHAIAGEAYDLAADLILPRADQLGAQGQSGELLSWLSALPEPLIEARPELALRYALALFLSGRHDEAGRWLAIGEAGLAKHPDAPPLAAALPEVISAMRAAARHDDTATLAHADRASALLPADALLWQTMIEIARGMAHYVRGEAEAAAAALDHAATLAANTGNSYGTLIGNWYLAEVRMSQARLSEASQVLGRLGGDGDTIYSGYRATGLAQIAYLRNDLATARPLAMRGLQALESSAGQPRVLLCAHCLLARLAHADGDEAAALTWLDAGEALAQRLDLPQGIATIAMLRANFAILADELDAAEAWAQAAELSTAELDLRREAELLTLARLLAVRGRSDKAQRIVASLRSHAEATGRIRAIVECKLVEALALDRSGATSSAEAELASAFDLAAPTGLVSPFREIEPLIAALIEGLRNGPQANDPATPLAIGLAALADSHTHTSLPSAPHRQSADGSYDALSERELRVLSLIATDCSNQEIASALIISVNTVKTHIKRIYEKLQVSSRAGAVARARELGLCR